VNFARKTMLGAALVGSTILGGAVGSSLLGTANAADTSTTAGTATTPSADATTPAPQHDPSQGGHTANGITEKLLTGDDKTKAEAAALAAVPGGTIQRVETDAEGATYEAHMTKADGSEVTVKMDASFKVTGVETGR
jgi:hypothetical protein